MAHSIFSRKSAILSIPCIASIFLEMPMLLNRNHCRIFTVLFVSIIALASSFRPFETNVRNRDTFIVGYQARQLGRVAFSPSPFIPRHIISSRSRMFLSLKSTPLDSKVDKQPEAENIGRDMKSLSEWSRSSEIILADGIELTEDMLGDWSLTTTKSIEQGSSILTVPSQVILTSDINGDSFLPYYNETDMQNVYVWMESELEMGSQPEPDYLPEYFLVYKLIREVYLGTESRWYPWLRSLPIQFSTGLYLDEVERNYVKRMTDEYIDVQNSQYHTCLELFQKLVSFDESSGTHTLMPVEFREWMLALQQDSNKEDSRFDNLVKWSFTIVFTRSWRSPDQKYAQIVPLGDLANHDSQFANLKPGFRQTDGAFQFFVTNDITVVESSSPKLYLSYGLTHVPARYLVLFGFCDVTAAYIDAQLDFLQDNDNGEWPTTLDTSQLVVSTLNGALSEEVWIAFLFKILEEKEPQLLDEIRIAFDDNDKRGNEMVEKVLDTWEYDVGKEIQTYYQRLLETEFVPITVTEKDLAEHPNLSMIVNYNLFVRETFLNVLEHVVTFLTQCDEFRALSTSKGENEASDTTSKTLKSSILDSKVNVSIETNDSYNSSTTKISLSQNSNSKTSQEILTKMSPQASYKEPIDRWKQGSNVNSLEKSEKTNLSRNTSLDSIGTDVSHSSATEDVDEQPFAAEGLQVMIDSNSTFESNNSETNQLPHSAGKMPKERSSNIATSKFSFQNFRLESYANTISTSDNGDSGEQFFSLDQTISEGMNQEAESGISTEDFNPTYLDGIMEEPAQGNIDFTAPLDNPDNLIESQSPTIFDRDSNPQAHTSDQKMQHASDLRYELNYDYSTSQQFSEGLPIATEDGTDYSLISDVPTGDMNSQYDSNDQMRSIENGIDASASSFFNKESADSKTFTISQVLPRQEREDTTRMPNFLDQYNESRSGPNSQSITTGEQRDSTAPSELPHRNTESLSNSVDQTELSQDGADFMTSYAQSLQFDQRRYSSAQQQSSEATPSPNQSDGASPSQPTTYAEYVQQRRDESSFVSGQQYLNTPTTEGYAVDGSEEYFSGNESIDYSNGFLDEYGEYQI